jgi:FkbM family methyltransferase
MKEPHDYLKKLGPILASNVPIGLALPILRGPLKRSLWITGALAGRSKGLSVLLNRYESRQMSQLKAAISSSDICFDIGANVGIYSLLFAKYCKQAISFEPLPRNISYLHRTLALNKIVNAMIVPFAVAGETKLTCFQEGEDWGVGRIVALGKQPAVTISIDEFIEKYRIIPTVMKIDVEGAELAVLQGAKRLLSENQPTIMLSVHGDDLRVNCLSYVRALGYRKIESIDNPDEKLAYDYLIRTR